MAFSTFVNTVHHALKVRALSNNDSNNNKDFGLYFDSLIWLSDA